MKLVLLSDTHTMHEQVVVPQGDVLVHAGDMALDGRLSEVQDALDWLNSQPFEHIVAIAGNHDFAFERGRLKDSLKLGRVTYLENDSCEIDGVKFWGSPVTPWFCDWAFNVHRGAPIRHYWKEIPDDVDVLITHGPPHGILDQSVPLYGSDYLGCEELFERVDALPQPLVHVFGHIHGGYGHERFGDQRFYNASVVNEAYKVVNAPWEVEL